LNTKAKVLAALCTLVLLDLGGLSCEARASESLELVAPESQGLSTDRLNRLTSAIHREIETGAVLGAVTLVARNGKIVHFEAQGFVDNGKTRPMETTALFRILSMTKPFVSVATMMLVEQGRLRLSDPVTDWLPELKNMTVMVPGRDGAVVQGAQTEPAARPITVHDLLRHTSGFTYPRTSPFPEIRDAYRQADILSRESDVSPDEFLQRLSAIPLAYQPGMHWEYGLSIDVLGVLLERLSTKPLHVLLQEMVFKPLRMKDTSFFVLPVERQRLAEMPASDPLKALVEKEARVTEDPMGRYRKGGGGAVSTARDYLRFAQMILNGGELDGVRLLSRKTMDYMLDDHVAGMPGAPSPGHGFGLGFGVRRPGGLASTAGSTGDVSWGGLGGTHFTVDRTEKLVGIYMAAAPSALDRMQDSFRNIMYGALVK
jgi:CubicO group peptidase (beta-lactamase class C family)